MSAKTLDDSAVEKKFLTAKNTQESIQSVSSWALHCKTQHKKIVEVWFNVLKKSKLQLRLTLFYLCNEIAQTCKRKHASMYKDSFKEVLPEATSLVRDASIRGSVERIFSVWKERSVFETEFVDELLSVIQTEETKTPIAVATKLVADFKPNVAREMLLAVVKLERENETKKRKLNLASFDETTNKNFKHLKDHSHGKQYTAQVDETHRSLADFVSGLETELTSRQQLVDQLEQSELFYDVQYGEAKIVTNAYKNFGTRVSNLRRRLDDVKKTLPDPLSPIPSPTLDAPSPSESITDAPTDSNAANDNTEAIDMDLSSDEDNKGGEAYSPGAGGDDSDSDPSPIDFEVSPTSTGPAATTVTVTTAADSTPQINYNSSFLSQLPLVGSAATDSPSSSGTNSTIDLFSMLAGLIKVPVSNSDPERASPAAASAVTSCAVSSTVSASLPAVTADVPPTAPSDELIRCSSPPTPPTATTTAGHISADQLATPTADSPPLYPPSAATSYSSSYSLYSSGIGNTSGIAPVVGNYSSMTALGKSVLTGSNYIGNNGLDLAAEHSEHPTPATAYFGAGQDDDGSTTPVQDEPELEHEEKPADPIALLNQLLSKGKSNVAPISGSSNFLQSLSLLTKGVVAEQKQAKAAAAVAASTSAVSAGDDDDAIYMGGYLDTEPAAETAFEVPRPEPLPSSNSTSTVAEVSIAAAPPADVPPPPMPPAMIYTNSVALSLPSSNIFSTSAFQLAPPPPADPTTGDLWTDIPMSLSQKSDQPSVLYTTPVSHVQVSPRLPAPPSVSAMNLAASPEMAMRLRFAGPGRPSPPGYSPMAYRQSDMQPFDSSAPAYPPAFRPTEIGSGDPRVITDYGHARPPAVDPLTGFRQNVVSTGNGVLLSPRFREPASGDLPSDGLEFAERLRRKTVDILPPADTNPGQFDEQHDPYYDAGGPGRMATSTGRNFDPSNVSSRGFHDPRQDWQHQDSDPGFALNRQFAPPVYRPTPIDSAFYDMPLRPPRFLPPPPSPRFISRPQLPRFERPFYPRY